VNRHDREIFRLLALLVVAMVATELLTLLYLHWKGML
jgi:hypothetical protein